MTNTTSSDSIESENVSVQNTPPIHADETVIEDSAAIITDIKDHYSGHALPEKPAQVKKKRGWFWRFMLIIISFFLVLFFLFAGAVYFETKTSYFQSLWFHRYAESLRFRLDSGPSDSIRFPMEGPFDTRMGYVEIPVYVKKLQQQGFHVDEQVRFSPELLKHVDQGFFVPYAEKTNAGLNVTDWRNTPVYQFQYPKAAYADFESIPSPIINMLLFIENRGLLKLDRPRLNPAVDWPRFSKAVIFKIGDALHIDTPSMGASTLATQVEKYRHSPDGITSSNDAKIKQMFSASTRIYQQGRETFGARQKLVLDYLNTVPLSAVAGFGEVNGIGDGLHAWFGSDFSESNQLLSEPEGTGEHLQAQAAALKRVLALMIAHRRPSYYLAQDQQALTHLTDSYLRVMVKKNVVSSAMGSAALASKLVFRPKKVVPDIDNVDSNKGANVVRNRLANWMGLSLYDLDRLDLNVVTSLHGELQDEISDFFRDLSKPEVAKHYGLIGEHLLTLEQVSALRFSFILMESTDYGNRVRVQTDNTLQPLDINEGSKLELGSTAKLRVMTSYLEIISELYARYNQKDPELLKEARTGTNDTITSWVLDRFIETPEISLQELLNASLERSYSANPDELFYTGGGIHKFANFRKEDNHRIVTLHVATQESINLPFVRLLKDIVNFTVAEKWAEKSNLMNDDNDPRRDIVLARFIDRESQVFLARFWKKYEKQSDDERLDTFLDGIRLTPLRLANIHRYLFPDASMGTFSAFMKERLPNANINSNDIQRFYKRYGKGAYSLEDQAYLARVHPLELWLLRFLQETPQPKWSAAVASSVDVRQQVYGWLLRTKAKNARDDRIQTMLEVEAFSDIHLRWKNLGYPFDHLVPSLATALGSSGDRPAALAELMGIIINEGRYAPAVRVERLSFGGDTPYETSLSQAVSSYRLAMNPVIASTLRSLLSDVVNKGTARRVSNTYTNADGSPMKVGGKTGTGDNRLVTQLASGERIASHALNRTATFVFYLGDHHFGALTAFVNGSNAGSFKFTSALPVQVLKGLTPLLEKQLVESERRQKLRALVNAAAKEAVEPSPATSQPDTESAVPLVEQGGEEPADGSDTAVDILVDPAGKDEPATTGNGRP